MDRYGAQERARTKTNRRRETPLGKRMPSAERKVEIAEKIRPDSIRIPPPMLAMMLS